MYMNSEADDIFLFQRLIFLKSSHKIGKFRLSGECMNMSAPTFNGQGVRGTKLMTFCLFHILIYYQNYHIIWVNLDNKNSFFRRKGAKAIAKMDGGHGRSGPLDPPLLV